MAPMNMQLFVALCFGAFGFSGFHLSTLLLSAEFRLNCVASLSALNIKFAQTEICF